jgi:hypothetical protein
MTTSRNKHTGKAQPKSSSEVLKSPKQQQNRKRTPIAIPNVVSLRLEFVMLFFRAFALFERVPPVFDLLCHGILAITPAPQHATRHEPVSGEHASGE